MRILFCSILIWFVGCFLQHDPKCALENSNSYHDEDGLYQLLNSEGDGCRTQIAILGLVRDGKLPPFLGEDEISRTSCEVISVDERLAGTWSYRTVWLSSTSFERFLHIESDSCKADYYALYEKP